MKKRSLIYLIAVLFALPVIISSCEKNSDDIPEVNLAEDDALASQVFDDVFQEVEDAMETMEGIIYDGTKKSASEVTCKTVTVEQPDDTTFWPRTITIEYSGECEGPNGRIHSGKIIVVVNKRYIDPEYYRTVSFEDFYVDGYKIEGVKTITNEGLNDNQNICYSVILENGKVTTPDGTEFTREFSRIREWIAGAETPRLRFDDEYLITGSASGINWKGLAFTRTITTPLHVAIACPWIMSGTVEIEVEGRNTAILDYGDDTCDRYATVTVGEESRTITIHR